MATHSSILVWRIPMDRKAGRLQSLRLLSIRYDWSDSACIRVLTYICLCLSCLKPSVLLISGYVSFFRFGTFLVIISSISSSAVSPLHMNLQVGNHQGCVRLYVQLHKLLHVSGVHCHMDAPSMSGCASVHFIWGGTVSVWNTGRKCRTTHEACSGFFFFPLSPLFFCFTSWRLITLQYCSGFCHTLTWISHGFTCVPHPDSPSHVPLHPIPLGLPSVPGPSTCLMHPTWAGDLFWNVN